MEEKYSWLKDKENNTWPDIIQNSIVRKNLKPAHLRKIDKFELRCEKHGIYARTVNALYDSLNKLGALGCPECSKTKALNKRMLTNLDRHGTEFIMQNKNFSNKLNWKRKVK